MVISSLHLGLSVLLRCILLAGMLLPAALSRGDGAVEPVSDLAGALSVRTFGAKGDGRTDDTGAFHAAISALGRAGGVVLVPPGDYRINVVITQSNVRVQGVASGAFPYGYATNRLRPYDVAKPIMQLGQDVGAHYVADCEVSDLLFDGLGEKGEVGSTGLLAAGGTYQGWFQRLSFYHLRRSIVVVAGTNVETSLITFVDARVVMGGYGEDDRGIYAQTPTEGSKWLTGLRFIGGHVNGGRVGKCMELRSAGASLVGGPYFDMPGTNGLLFTTNLTGATGLPRLHCAGEVSFDGDGTKAIVQLPRNDMPLDWYITGTYSLWGGYALSDGTVIKGFGSRLAVNAPVLTYPYVRGVLNLSDEAAGTNDFAPSGANRVNVDRGTMRLISAGHLSLQPNAGVVELHASQPGQHPVLRFQDAAPSKPFDISASRAGLELTPGAAGAEVRVRGDKTRLVSEGSVQVGGVIEAGGVASAIAAGGSTTLSGTNSTYLANVEGARVVLPSAVGRRGRAYTVKLVAPAASGELRPAAGELIDGAARFPLQGSNATVTVQSDSTNWWVLYAR